MALEPALVVGIAKQLGWRLLLLRASVTFAMRQGSPVQDRRCPRNCERRVRGDSHWFGAKVRLGRRRGQRPRARRTPHHLSISAGFTGFLLAWSQLGRRAKYALG